MIKNTYTVMVNNIPYAIVPNSLEYNPGYAEHTTEAASVGGGITTPIHSENLETAIGKIKFKLPNTDVARAAVQIWKSLIGANVIQCITKTGAPVILTEASMNNNPDFKNDGIEIEFSGAQMTIPL